MTSRSSPRGSPWQLADNSSSAPASVCVPSARPASAKLGHRGHVGRLGQLEGQPAELRRRAADLRDAALLLFAGRQQLRLPAAMRDRRRLGRRQHVGFVVRRRRPAARSGDRRRITELASPDEVKASESL